MRIIAFMKKVYPFLILLGWLQAGCVQRLRVTTLLENHIYLEFINVNPFGVDEVIMTDSTNFRVCIAKYYSDHEGVYCKTNGDTITVVKVKDEGRIRTIIDSAKLSRDSLIKNKVHSSTPLLDFK
jgi:hypothetical protein